MQVPFTLSSVAITGFAPSDALGTGTGLEVAHSTTVTLPKTVHLLPGQTLSFALFAISTPERSLDPEDYLQRAIGVDLEFSSPNVSARLTGVTGSLGIADFGIGYVNWSGPLVVPFGDNRRVIITLSDTVFGLDNHVAHVIATIAYEMTKRIEVVELRPEAAKVQAFTPGLTALARSERQGKKS